MDLATFRGLLARHGPDLERWPAAAADAAVELMAISEDAQDLFAEATARQGEADHDAGPLVERIMGAIKRR
jgi:hypothetical protein